MSTNKPNTPSKDFYLTYIPKEKEIVVATSFDGLKNSLDSYQNKKCITFEKMIEKIQKKMIYGLDKFEKNFFECINHAIANRCFSKQAFNYIQKIMNLYSNSINLLKKQKDFSKTVCDPMWEKLSQILSQNLQFKQPTQISSKNYRCYQKIDFYVSGLPNNEIDGDPLDRIKSLKAPFKCPENCNCFSIENMGTFSLEQSTWLSSCPNRRENMECGIHSHPGHCFNMAISLCQDKKSEIDVCEQVCWGVDTYTKNLIVKLLSDQFTDDQKFNFIQYDLIKALNFQVFIIIFYHNSNNNIHF